MSQYEYCELDYEILKAGWFKHIYIWVARDITPGSRSYGEVIYRFRPHKKAEEAVENSNQPPRSVKAGGNASRLRTGRPGKRTPKNNIR